MTNQIPFDMTSRRPFAPRRRSLLRAGSGLLAAAALGRSARAVEVDARLRIGLAAPNTTMDPHLQSNAPNNAVASHIFDALVTNDEQSRSVPGLAESWRVVDDTHWEFRLRQLARRGARVRHRRGQDVRRRAGAGQHRGACRAHRTMEQRPG